MIEKGRYLNLNKDYRYCPVCLHNGMRTVQDEMHFLLVCPLYNNLQKELFPTLCLNGQFIILCQTKTNTTYSIVKLPV